MTAINGTRHISNTAVCCRAKKLELVLPQSVSGRRGDVDCQCADYTPQLDVQDKPSVGHFFHCSSDVLVVSRLLEVARLRYLVNKLQHFLSHRQRPTAHKQPAVLTEFFFQRIDNILNYHLNGRTKMTNVF